MVPIIYAVVHRVFGKLMRTEFPPDKPMDIRVVGWLADGLLATGRVARWVVDVFVFAIGAALLVTVFGHEAAWENPAAWAVIALYGYATVWPVGRVLRCAVDLASRRERRPIALGTAVLAMIVVSALVILGLWQLESLMARLFDAVTTVVEEFGGSAPSEG